MARTRKRTRIIRTENRTPQGDTTASLRDRMDAKLDEALKATFPASDPFALTVDVSSAAHDEPEAATEKAADAK
jgi:2-methylcitrate dehydratase PrpD